MKIKSNHKCQLMFLNIFISSLKEQRVLFFASNIKSFVGKSLHTLTKTVYHP